jgi:hypoxanthine-DNA glycosylase
MCERWGKIVGDNPKILILGTFPSIDSCTKGVNYAGSAFWELLGLKEPDDFKKEEKMLTDNNIALWEMFESADRKESADKKKKKSSSDDNLINIKTNNIYKFLTEHESIEKVYITRKTPPSAKEPREAYKKIIDEIERWKKGAYVNLYSPAYMPKCEDIKKWVELASRVGSKFFDGIGERK